MFMWFIFALVSIFSWGTADLFYKKANKPDDDTSHLKTVIMVGLVMGLHAFYVLLTSSEPYRFVYILNYLPVSSMYILSMAIGYAGLRYIELSIASPVQNTSGAITALLTFFFLGQKMTPLQFGAVFLISVGLVVLGILENQDVDDQDLVDQKEVSRYRVGAVALVLPVLYALVDALGTFFDAYFLTGIMTEQQANVSYELTFFICAVLVFLYLIFVKKEKIQIRTQGDNLFAAGFETFVQFFYVYAMAQNAVIVAPLISSYSMVSVLLSRIFLKEKLKKSQYLMITVILVGIVILGIE